ncbi:MAG: hypothetical protein ACXWP5_03610 [Bdellovibrionota bacterium]
MLQKVTNTLRKTPLQLRVFLACLALLILRSWDRLTHAQIWAEDGSRFLPEAYQYGVHSLLIPIGGYFLSVSRLIALIATSGPTTMAAFWVTSLSLLVFGACISFISREEFAHLIPSKSVRISVAIGLCFVSGMTEGFGNLANLHWILVFWLGLLALRPVAAPLSFLTLLLAWLAAGSGGESVVLIPVFGYRLILALKRREPRWRFEAFLGGITGFWAVASFFVRQPGAFHPMPPLVELFRAGVFTFLNHFILHPVLGDQITWIFGSLHPYSWYWIFSLAILGWYIASSRAWKADGPVLLWLCLGAFWGIAVVTWIFRVEAFPLYLTQVRTFGWYGARYALHMAPIAFVTAASLLPRWKGRYSQTVGLVFVSFFVAFAMHHFRITRYVPWDPSFADQVASMKCSPGGPAEIPISTEPPGWSTRIPASKLPCASERG